MSKTIIARAQPGYARVISEACGDKDTEDIRDRHRHSTVYLQYECI